MEFCFLDQDYNLYMNLLMIRCQPSWSMSAALKKPVRNSKYFSLQIFFKNFTISYSILCKIFARKKKGFDIHFMSSQWARLEINWPIMFPFPWFWSRDASSFFRARILHTCTVAYRRRRSDDGSLRQYASFVL